MNGQNKNIYKETLNLPKTDFPMKASLPEREPDQVKRWEESNIYQKIRKLRKGKSLYHLHDGPPYANGHIHMGHVLNKILKDIIVKYKSLRGFDAPYIPGWDCHGLPIEHKLLEKISKTKHEVSQVEFRKQACDFALKWMDIQRQEFKRLGILGDWENPYLTLNPEYEATILKGIRDIHRAGYMYKSKKPVLWCMDCETALAEAEVEYAD
ncbi:Isoleucyl-tRNA synthetase, partial [sediment metagenome]